jgi:L-threonylcarbamoyladenylate synthase
MPFRMVRSVSEAARLLKAGALVVYPTETAYALGADPQRQRAVRAIFTVKGRARRTPLPLIVASVAMAARVACLNAAARALARRAWPGPLTLVLPSRRRWARGVAAADGTVAVRVSGSPVARALSRSLGRPVVATSANRSGGGNAYSPRAVRRQLAGTAATVYVLSAGRLPRRRSSTVALVRGAAVTVLRQGSVRVGDAPQPRHGVVARAGR